MWQDVHGERPTRIIVSPSVGRLVLKWLPAAEFDVTDKLYGMQLFVREQGHPVLFEREPATVPVEPLAGAFGIADDTAPTDVLRRVAVVLRAGKMLPKLSAALDMYLDTRIPHYVEHNVRERIIQL